MELPLDTYIVSFGFSTNNKNLRNWNVDYKRSSVTVNALIVCVCTQFETSEDVACYSGNSARIAEVKVRI